MTLTRRTHWERFFTTPPAPSNYVDQKKIDKYVAEKVAEREAQAQFIPVAGTVRTCVVIDGEGNTVINESAEFGSKEGEISYRVMTALSDMLGLVDGSGDLTTEQSPWDCGAIIFGLNIRDRLRVMALDAIDYVNRTGNGAHLPPGLWYSQTFTPGIWCDPYEAVIPSDRRKDIPYNGLCEFLGITVPPGLDPDTDAHMQAQLAREIALRTQLIHNRQ